MILNYKEFITESNGTNTIVKKLTKHLLNIINYNFGKLLINKKIILNNSLSNFKDINFTNDEIEISISNKPYGYIKPNSLTISGNTIDNLKMTLHITLKSYEISSKELQNNEISSIISHEFSHIIELFLSKNKSKSWFEGESLQFLQHKYTSDINFQKISHMIYLSLPHEIRARIEQLNSDIEINNLKDRIDILNYIKNSKIYNDVKNISKTSPEFIINELKKDINFNNILTDINNLLLNNYTKDYEKELLKYFKKLKERNIIYSKKLLKIICNFENENYNTGDSWTTPEGFDDYLSSLS